MGQISNKSHPHGDRTLKTAPSSWQASDCALLFWRIPWSPWQMWLSLLRIYGAWDQIESGEWLAWPSSVDAEAVGLIETGVLRPLARTLFYFVSVFMWVFMCVASADFWLREKTSPCRLGVFISFVFQDFYPFGSLIREYSSVPHFMFSQPAKGWKQTAPL